MSDRNKLTIDELLRAAERELSMRERVYPKWVATERMPQSQADYELQAMRQIVDLIDLFRRFEHPAREFFARKIADVRAIERHPAAEAMREAFPDARFIVHEPPSHTPELEEHPDP
jgi:hypothetical protein